MKRALCAVLITFCTTLGAQSPGLPQQHGMFQLPHVCDTYLSLLRLNELLTQAKERDRFERAQQEILVLLNSRTCFEVERGTMFQVVRRVDGATQIELMTINLNRQPPRQSLGLYWGATEQLARHMWPPN
jgi:hypothetical protein